MQILKFTDRPQTEREASRRASSSHPMKLTIRILIGLVLLTGVMVFARRASHPLPYWRYESLTAPNATYADLEQSMRSVLGADHAEFTYLGPHELGFTSFGASPRLAENLSGRLEHAAAMDLKQRGLGPVTDTSGADSDGDPEDFPFWRVHHFLRNLGLPGLRFDAVEGPEWPFKKRFEPGWPFNKKKSQRNSK